MKMFRGAAVAAAIAGSMAAYNAQAVNLSTDGIGEVAIAPFYTVRDGWSTLINLTNTDANPVAVKVRFHEAHNSRDVLDFTVLLSGYDVFTGIVTENANGEAIFRSTDSPNDAGLYTCTIPTVINKLNANGDLPDIKMSTAGFKGATTGDDDDGVLTTDRLKEGYIEFIVMGHASAVGDGNPSYDLADFGVPNEGDADGIAVLDVGQAIENHRCDGRLDAAFSREVNNDDLNNPQADPEILQTARQFGEPINALKFNFRLINVDRGVEAGNSATTWANFYNPAGGRDAVVTPFAEVGCGVWRGAERHNSDVGTPTFRTLANNDWLPNGANGVYNNGAATPSCRNLIAEQQRQAFLEPTLNDAYPVVANWWDTLLNAAVSMVPDPTYLSVAGTYRGVDAVSATIMRKFVVNEWSTNPGAGVTTDWIVTQPTKQYYVDGTNQFFQLGAEAKPYSGVTGIDSNEAIQSALATERYEAQIDFDGDGAFEAKSDTTGVLPLSIDLPLAPYSNRWALRAGQTYADACNEVGFGFYDRAEQTPAGPSSGVIVSPQLPETPNTDNICHEATVITFNGASAFTDSGAQLAVNRVDVDTSALTNTNGWMLLDLAPNDEALPFNNLATESRASSVAAGQLDAGGAPLAGAASADAQIDQIVGAPVATAIEGLPVIGFNLKVRSLGSGSAASNYASTLDHGFVRQYND